MRWMKLEPIIQSEIHQKEKDKNHILTHIYIKSRKVVPMILLTGQQRRHRCKEKSFGLSGKIEILIKNIFLITELLRLEIKCKEKETVKTTNTWRGSKIQLNNQWITEEIKGNFLKYTETKENESTMIQNLWDVAKQF